MTSNGSSSGMRRRTVLSIAGAGALGSLAGCLSTLSSGDGVGSDDSATNTTDDDTAGEDAPLTDYAYTAPPQVVDLAEQDHTSTLRTVPARHQLVADEAKGGPVELPEVWAWQADDLEPSVPGPIYRMREGETFELTYENTEHDRPHTVHVHGVGKSWRDDGAPVSTRIDVQPGESHTYELEGDVPGTHFYHCHVQTHNHLDMGDVRYPPG